VTEAEIARFLYREARLLDEKQWEAWYDLFTEDGHYWVPLTRGHAEGAALLSGILETHARAVRPDLELGHMHVLQRHCRERQRRKRDQRHRKDGAPASAPHRGTARRARVAPRGRDSLRDGIAVPKWAGRDGGSLRSFRH